MYVVKIKSTVEISQNLVAFLEYMNLKKMKNGRGRGQKLGKLVTSFMDGPYHGTSSNLQYNKCRFFFVIFE